MNKMTGNNKYDNLGELFRQRLENHSLPLEVDVWENIEQRLNKRKKKKAVIWMWSSGIAAAAAVALLLIIVRPELRIENGELRVENEESGRQKAESGMQKAEGGKAESEKEESRMQKAEGRMKKAEGEKEESRMQKVESEKAEGEKAESRMQNEEPFYFCDEKSEILKDSFPIKGSDPELEKEIEKFKNSLIEDSYNNGTSQKKDSKWLLAAAFGTGSYSDNNSSSLKNEMFDVSDGLTGHNSYASKMSNIIQPFNEMSLNAFSDISHSPPLSFGLNVRKSFGKRLGLESGLVYTYLSSRFKWTNYLDYVVYQRLHYLGIPVNLTVNIWNLRPDLRVYMSCGGIVEKGLQAIYKQEILGDNFIVSSDVESSNIDGLQWSLNGALGIDYRIVHGFGIYFEPRVGYCFNNKQPVSIRTEWPVYVGFSIGLNFELLIK